MPYFTCPLQKFDGGTGNVIGDVMELPSQKLQHMFGRCLLPGATFLFSRPSAPIGSWSRVKCSTTLSVSTPSSRFFAVQVAAGGRCYSTLDCPLFPVEDEISRFISMKTSRHHPMLPSLTWFLTLLLCLLPNTLAFSFSISSR